MSALVIDFKDLRISDVSSVGGKNASLGEMFHELTPEGVNVPDGFATTADAFWKFLDLNSLREPLQNVLDSLDRKEYSNLHQVGGEARKLMLEADFPDDLKEEILEGYKRLKSKYNEDIQLAVRSSATAEDLPNASFAGQHESYLNIAGDEMLIRYCQYCLASLFTDRAIKYREVNGFEHMKVALSIGVQKMVRSDISSAGVIFTIDPESGFKDAILITGAWGLGENVVQGAVDPDEFFVFKTTLKKGKNAIISKKIGDKHQTMMYADSPDAAKPIINTDTPPEKREEYVLSDQEILQVAKWAQIIEDHYQRPMDIEWAKDGVSQELYIVQARPETIHSNLKDNLLKAHEYTLLEEGRLLTKGKGIGNKIVTGTARVLESPEEIDKLQRGEILVTEITNPDWDPILKKASAIVTNRGGRTSHAAIVAREQGALAVVGTGNATDAIKSGDVVTVSCTDNVNGLIYEGALKFDETQVDLVNVQNPQTVQPMFILGDPDKAFMLSHYPNEGVGLMRMEFIINNTIQVHPMALVQFNELTDAAEKEKIEKLTHHYKDKKEYFVQSLSYAIGTTAAAFYPKDVIVRMSDFKTNEYSNLIGGKQFEPDEENPMLGFRGASRYYSERYREGFALECKAIKRVRDEMGFDNVKMMIPFCRTVEEGKKVLDIMKGHGLVQGENGLEVYVMVELPSNVIRAKEFAEIFDGFSIGSNDLTQLTLGIDRDSSTVSELFNERDPATMRMIAWAIQTAKETGTKIGLCGQAPSDFPEFARFLVEQGINSISFNPDAIIKGIENITAAEQQTGP